MRKRSAALFLILILPLQYAAAFNWPVIDPLITSTFGSAKWGAFGNGIELYGDGLEVRPSESGEVIFVEDSAGRGNLPSGLGSFMVIEHERKLRTLYSGLEISADVEGKENVSASDIIGYSGAGGKSTRPGVYFSVIDSEFEQYVNPLLLLNTIVDNRPPAIREIGIETAEGYTPVDKKASVKAGDARIIADIYDPCLSDVFFCPMAPFKVHLFLNGEEIFYINFESMRYEPSGAVIQSQDEIKYSDYYTSDGRISLGEIALVPGDLRFEVLVSDYSENEATYSFQLNVTE